MKRLAKIFGITVAALALILIAAISLTIGWRPFLGPRSRTLTDRRFQSTPERLARGQYLVNGVVGCLECHSEHDWKAPGAPVVAGKAGAGQIFPLEGLPGRIVAPNITPDRETGTGRWTDDQLARVIREGISHDGRALFPLMPYQRFRTMSDEDLASVVVYIRTLPTVRNPLPATEIIFPVKYLIRNEPQPVTEPVPQPDSSSAVKRGEYMVRMGGCVDCHTPQHKGQYDMTMAFAGGFHLKGPWGDVTGPNITPDPSGISYYDETLFLEVMRTGRVKARDLNSIMPWSWFRNMTDDDLKAIFAYLRTVKPIHHRVDNTEPPTLCKLCGGMHGGGDEN